MDEIDVWRAANEMMKLFGDDAATRAAMRADAMLDEGDVDGFHAWTRIARAIDDLRRTPSDSEPRN
jgi:hypothetical protein